MNASRPPLPNLPTIAKSLSYDADASKTSSFPYSQPKSPLTSERLLKRLKLLHTKSFSTFLKTQKEEIEKAAQASARQMETSDDSATVKIEVRVDKPVKGKDMVPQKKRLPKLYNSIYKKYTEKMNSLKDKCLNSNVIASNLPSSIKGDKTSLQQLAQRTEEKLQNSYSIKYLTVQDEGIGILSRRVPITQLEPRNLRTKSIGRCIGLASLSEKSCEAININKKRNSEQIKSTFSVENIHDEAILSKNYDTGDLEENLNDIKQTPEEEYRKRNFGVRNSERTSEHSETKFVEILKGKDEIDLNIKGKERDKGIRSCHDLNQSQKLDPIQYRKTPIDPLEDNRYLAYGGDPRCQKVSPFTDSTPKEIYTSYVMNKFVPPYKLQALKKLNNLNNQKKTKIDLADPEKLSREVYITANFASFERQVASLGKLKSTMLRGRAKSNIRLDSIQPSNSDLSKKSQLFEVRQNKKIPKQSSYTKLLNTMYTQEDLESELPMQENQGDTAKKMHKEGELKEDQELNLTNLTNFQIEGTEKIVKNERRSQSCDLYQDPTHLSCSEKATKSKKNLL